MVSLHDIMSLDVVTVTPESTLREVAELLSAEHIGGVPVVSGEEVVGVISASDLVTFDADSRGVPTTREEGRLGSEGPDAEEWREGEAPVSDYFVHLWDNVGTDVRERLESSTSPEWDVLSEHTAGEIMTRSVLSLPRDTDVQEAARYMLRESVHRILVMVDGRLEGVVTTTDIVKAVAQHGLGG